MSSLSSTQNHIFMELTRLDLFIHRRMDQMNRAHSLKDELIGLDAIHVSEMRAQRVLQQPFGLLPGELAEEDIDAESDYTVSLASVERQIAEMVDAAAERDDHSGLVVLASIFELSRFDLDALLVCLAPAFDLRYEVIYSYLLDDLTQRRPTVNLILDLLCAPGIQRLEFLAHFRRHSPLFRHHLLEYVSEPGAGQYSLLNQPLAVEPGLVAWLQGVYQPANSVRPFIEFVTQPGEQLGLLLPERVEQLESQTAQDALIALTGRDAEAQRLAARWYAARFGAPLLTLHLALVLKQNADMQEVSELFLRDTLLTGAVGLVTGWDACLEEGAPPAMLFRTLCRHPAPLMISCEARWHPPIEARSRRMIWLDFPVPDYQQRRRILERLVEGVATNGALDLEGLAGRFALTTGQFESVLDSAIDLCTQQNRPLSNDDLFAAARAQSSPRLTTLARKLTPRYEWSDLILPDDQVARLRELVDMVRGRAQVLDEWGVGSKLAASFGISALFAGPPGTGKTMAAEVMARMLGLDLYKIDLSSMVSKYIGETEKNLERIFTEAESSNAILFFDEADAIFGKRSEVKDAHDRYANIEVSYLLQRMEAYDGVTILATNLRSNLDEAFTRRLNMVVDFPFPEATQRVRIWQTLFPSSVPHSEDVDFGLMARRFKLAGGNIRNIIVNAAHLAAANGEVVTMRHLMHAARREMQKLGRLTEERDFAH
jgi:hypothetical protein